MTWSVNDSVINVGLYSLRPQIELRLTKEVIGGCIHHSEGYILVGDQMVDLGKVISRGLDVVFQDLQSLGGVETDSKAIALLTLCRRINEKAKKQVGAVLNANGLLDYFSEQFCQDLARPEKVIFLARKLSTGKLVEIVKSARSAVDPGIHMVITTLRDDGTIYDHGDLTYAEKGQCCAVLMEFLDEQSPEKTWVIGLNGEGVTVRTTYHPHGIIAWAKGQILRLVFNGKAYLEKLKSAFANKSWDEVEEAIKELENNLK